MCNHSVQKTEHLKKNIYSGPFLAISDIHGHWDAFQTLLKVTDQLGIRDIVVAGDVLYGSPNPSTDPAKLWLELQRRKARMVRGLSDRALVTLSAEKMLANTNEEQEKKERFIQTQRALGDVGMHALKQMPDRIRIGMVDGSEALVVHGSPKEIHQELSFDMSDEEMMDLIGDEHANLILCGGSHVPFVRDLPGLRVVGLGSVGEAPEGTHIHYTIVTPTMSGIAVEQKFLERQT